MENLECLGSEPPCIEFKTEGWSSNFQFEDIRSSNGNNKHTMTLSTICRDDSVCYHKPAGEKSNLCQASTLNRNSLAHKRGKKTN